MCPSYSNLTSKKSSSSTGINSSTNLQLSSSIWLTIAFCLDIFIELTINLFFKSTKAPSKSYYLIVQMSNIVSELISITYSVWVISFIFIKAGTLLHTEMYYLP